MLTWEKSIFFFDIDDTLIDTEGCTNKASSAMQPVLEPKFGKKQARLITTKFAELFNRLLEGYRVRNETDWHNVSGGKAAFDDLLRRITKLQVNIEKEYGAIKKWSREVLIKLACDELSLQICTELIAEAADAYWLSVSENASLLTGALALFKEIKTHNRPIFLLTSSDARLTLDEKGQFRYDPAYSEACKRTRIELLREKGLWFHLVSIGDPEDKPHMDFFQKGIRLAEQDLDFTIELNNCIMVGDSYEGDLKTPREKLHFGLAVLFKKNQKELKKEDDALISCGNLIEILSMFK